MPPEKQSRSGGERQHARAITELLRSLSTDVSALVRQELALARAEMRETLRSLSSGAGRAVAGGSVAGVGALTVVAGIVVLVGQLIGSYWIGALLVGGVLLAVGALLAVTGARRISLVDPAPRRSIASIGDTARWARTEAASLIAAMRGRRPPRLSAAPDKLPDPLPAPQSLGTRQATAAVAADPPVAAATARTASPELRFDRGTSVAERSTAPAAPATAALDPAAEGRANTPPPRDAGTPAFLKHVGREIMEDNITGQAARLAYYAFMALPPALMALFGLAGLIGSERFALWLDMQAAMALPEAVHEGIIAPFIEQVVLEQAPGPFSIGLLLALWGGSAMFAALIDALNHAYDITENRSFLRKRALAGAVLPGGVLLFIGAAGSLLIAPVVVEYLGFGRAGEIAWNIAQWPVAFGFMVVAFWCAYYFLPNRDQRASRSLLARAAAIAAALWVLATAGFRIYISNFSSYSETYGFLGAFIILLLWLYVTGLVVLVGGELASEMERRDA